MDYTKERLEALIEDGIEESGQLEYKAAASLARDEGKVAELTKDISAFANAAGGVLIYGIAEHRDKALKHLPERLDPVNQSEFSREWLDQKIALIRPRIEGLRVTPVHVGPAISDYCYVVEIPQSSIAHQARDFRYYRRRNFESAPMEDYEIRDVMNRRKHPKVQLTMRINADQSGARSNVFWKLENVSMITARSFFVVIKFPLRLKANEIHFAGSQAQMRTESSKSNEVYWRLEISNSGDRPLFPSDEFTGNFDFSFPHSVSKRLPSISEVRYKIFADDMPFVRGIFETESITHWFNSTINAHA